jgi:hypothetical protein
MSIDQSEWIIKGFIPLKTHHCVSGSMRNIYQFNDYPISEDAILGLGSGVGFIYWHTKGTVPFLGGRANVGRPGEEGFEITIAKRTGVNVVRYETPSEKKAEKRILEMLQSGIPVMFYVDMGFLPYFNLPPGTHFGAHMVVAAGINPQTSQIFFADRDGLLHPVSISDARLARNSKFKPFPPKNAWFEFDFSHAHKPNPEEFQRAIFETSAQMVKPPISNIGVSGIFKAAQRVTCWPDTLDEALLRDACINGYIFIDASGGTGGGLFRYMYSRFLHEAVDYTGIKGLEEISMAFINIGNRWQEVALLFKDSYQSETPVKYLKEIGVQLRTIADLEKSAWEKLFNIIQE